MENAQLLMHFARTGEKVEPPKKYFENLMKRYEDMENAQLLMHFARTGEKVEPPKVFNCLTCAKDFPRIYKCLDCVTTSCADCILFFHQHTDRRYPLAVDIYEDMQILFPVAPPRFALDMNNMVWVNPANPLEQPIPSSAVKSLWEIRARRLAEDLLAEAAASQANTPRTSMSPGAPPPTPECEEDMPMPMLEREGSCGPSSR
uniref:B box-type domain-containing protein n=1 Tax=Steinernema glaseri TaxID=37863 RepID=A0A1I7ZCY9_9BILA